MSTANNKRIVEAAFAAFAEGDGRPFNAAMADDVVWIVEGGPWARTHRGKAAVVDDLQRPLVARLAGRMRLHAERLVAEDDTVVVLARGEALTNSGEPYNNRYCFVIRLKEGKFVEIREYMDGALVQAVLGPAP